MESLYHSHTKRVIAFLFFLMCGFALLGLMRGSMRIPLRAIISYPIDPRVHTVIFKIRLPRVLLALGAGMALSIAGATFQGIFRNPLVSPYLLGVAPGAAFGAAIGFALSLSYPLIPSLAFLFGLLAVFTAYSISRLKGYDSTITLLLSGIIVSAFFSALTSFIQFLVTKEKLSSIVFWMMGGFSLASWRMVDISLPIILVCSLLLYLMSWRLNVISLGDEEAKSLGINVERTRTIFISLSTLIVAIIVSFTGTIGWVGLVVPHLARILIGTDHRYLLLASLFLGASFMLGADIITRSIMGMEIPVGIITSLIGAPFFIYLLIKRREPLWD